MVSFPIFSSRYLVVCSGNILPASRVVVAIPWIRVLLSRVSCGLVDVELSASMAYCGFFSLHFPCDGDLPQSSSPSASTQTS